jgi:aspartate/methionine/tyrosine aminotransferase
MKYWRFVEMDLGSSNIEGLSFSEFGQQIEDFDLSIAYPFGEESLRKMLAEEYGVGSENVTVTVGASEANFLIGLALLKKGDKVVVENPAYQTLVDIPRGLGFEVHILERKYEDAFVLDGGRLLEMIRGGARFAFLCNPHNPTGVPASGEDLKEIAEVAEEMDAYVLVDEIFREVMSEGRPPLAYSISDRMIVTSSISKVFGMGALRLGWAIARSDLIEKIEGVKEYVTVAAASPSERIAKLALARKKELLERAWGLVRNNRAIVKEWIEGNEHVEYSTLGEVNFCFPRLVGADEVKFGEIAAEKYKTLIAPGRFFGLPSHFRLGYGMNTKKLEKGLNNLTLALREAATS